MRYFTGILFSFIAVAAHGQLSGYVKDNYSQIVANAKLIFVNEQDPSIKYESVTNANGFYSVSLTSAQHLTSKTTLYKASPNPFYNNTEIAFSLEKDCRVMLAVYNLNGQLIRILENARLSADEYSYSWDGNHENGARVIPGLYLIVLDAGGKKLTQKVVVVPYQQVASVGTFHELKSFTINTYQIIITAENADTLLLRNIAIPENKLLDFSLYRKPLIPFATVTGYLGVWNGTGFNKLFIKGVNLGVSVPGTLPGELAATREQYSRWLNMIGNAGFNAIRTYTLHYPRFYQELAIYNNAHPDKPIYLFQGIWLQEDTLNGNLYPYTAGFDAGIEEVVDCIHGKKTIGERYGRAFGKFDADVSRWTLGFIIGREIHPYEVEITDFLNSTITHYEGSNLKISTGTPTEVWLAERLDKLITFEKNKYKVQRPVSVSSWPTLDPMEHPSEPDDLTDEDKFSFDLKKIVMNTGTAGYFASYHAYPYYPDFINRDAAYLDDTDDIGPNPYLGYLRHLKSHYSGIPLIIAEYGVPSSWGIAHTANSGMNHGGLTEVQQGEMNVRLLKNIHTAGCGGGMMFSWIDEWFKRTWLFDPIKSTPERMPLWHSVASAEENFGMIAFDPPAPVFQQYPMTGSVSKIASVHAAADVQFFNLKLNLNSSISVNDSVWIGIDTYKESVGESVLPNGAVVSKRSEFAMLIKADSVKLFVTRDYDLFGIWFIRNNANPEQVFHSTVTNGAPWHLLRLKHNFEEASYQKTGILKVRKAGVTATSLDAVWFNGNEMNFRVPWHYLNFTDPSARLVMDDDRSTNTREVTLSDGIALTISYKKETATSNRYVWNTWDKAPVTTERVKPALNIIKAGNSQIGDNPSTKKKK